MLSGGTLRKVKRRFQIVPKVPKEKIARSMIAGAKHGRGMYRRHHVLSERHRQHLPTVTHQAKGATQNRFGGGSSKAENDLWLDRIEFGQKPGAAGLDLRHPWILVQTMFSGAYEFEVLDRVGHVYMGRIERNLRQGTVQNLSGRTDKGLSL